MVRSTGNLSSVHNISCKMFLRVKNNILISNKRSIQQLKRSNNMDQNIKAIHIEDTLLTCIICDQL